MQFLADHWLTICVVGVPVAIVVLGGIGYAWAKHDTKGLD